jgi:nicotinamide-nucleotide amidase
MSSEPLEKIVGELLRRGGLWLAVAESCTGGLIADRITNISGSSDYFLGGVVAYANRIKIEQLGVSPATLDQFGAVSRETVLEMAQGVRHRLGADIGLSVSGIAGPGGGTPEKPVGLTWIGLSGRASHTGSEKATSLLAWSYVWTGDRLEVKAQTAEQALRLLYEYLDSLIPSGRVLPPPPPDPAS